MSASRSESETRVELLAGRIRSGFRVIGTDDAWEALDALTGRLETARDDLGRESLRTEMAFRERDEWHSRHREAEMHVRECHIDVEEANLRADAAEEALAEISRLCGLWQMSRNDRAGLDSDSVISSVSDIARAALSPFPPTPGGTE